MDDQVQSRVNFWSEWLVPPLRKFISCSIFSFMHVQGESVNNIYCTLFYVAKVLSRSHTIFVCIELKLTIQIQFICMELNTYSLV